MIWPRIFLACLTATCFAAADGMASVSRGKGKGRAGVFARRTGTPPLVNTYSTTFVRTSSQYATCGDVAVGNSANVTWSFWMKPATWPVTTPGDLINKVSATEYSFIFRIQENTTGRMYLYFPASATDATRNWLSASSAFSLSWQHVAIVFNGAGAANADKVRVYRNATEITGAGTFAGTIAAVVRLNTENMRIGAWGGTAQNYFNGQLDEIAIWVSRSLTAGEVTEVYNVGKPSTLTALTFAAPTHWWRMGDGDALPTLTDAMGAMNCTTTNNPAFAADVP